MHITLLVPELLWPEPDDRETWSGLHCPALETLLARSRFTEGAAQSLEATLCDRFGYPDGAPYAVLRLLGEPNAAPAPDQHNWLMADPVHLRFHQDRLLLADGASLSIGLDEAQAIVDGLNEHFGSLGHFHVAAPERWYLRLAEATELQHYHAPPLSTVAGRSVEQLLPELLHERAVRRLINEIQTVLHAHPINRQREDDGRLPINSLWLWGNGSLPERRASDYDGVWSTQTLARGLARASGVPVHPLPQDAATLMAHVAAQSEHLVLLEDLVAPVQFENGAGYRSALAGLEQRWFAPLRKAVLNGQLDTLCVEASTVYATLTWRTRRAEQWRLWRKARPLSSWAQELAAAQGSS